MKGLMLLACFLGMGCAHAPKTLDAALGEVIAAASGPCAAKLLETRDTCKAQYPGLSW